MNKHPNPSTKGEFQILETMKEKYKSWHSKEDILPYIKFAPPDFDSTIAGLINDGFVEKSKEGNLYKLTHKGRLNRGIESKCEMIGNYIKTHKEVITIIILAITVIIILISIFY